MQREYDLEFRYVFFPLHPETPTEGQTLEELFRGRNFDVQQAQLDMAKRMEAEGLLYGSRTHTYNSRLAQELAKWAETQRPVGEFVMSLYQAYFVEGQNIGLPEVLLEIVDQSGLSVDEARRALETRQFRDSVDADWQRCRAIGLTGVPAFIAGQNGVVGAQPYEVLEQLVTKAGAEKR